MKFYFTFGAEGHPFRGGWAEVHAASEDRARRAFMDVHPSDDGVMRCCSVYNVDEFDNSVMYTKGNLGHRCREVITLTVEKGEDA